MLMQSKKKSSLFSGFFFIASLVPFFNAAAADDYSTWPYSCAITMNTSASGANVTTDGAYKGGFPVLIRLNPGNFSGFANTNPGGSDIRFSKNFGAHLAYQIERWVDGPNNQDTAEIWVRLDTVWENNNTQSFKMYWGNTAAVDSSSGSATFPTTDYFEGVWHFSKTALTDTFADATSNGLSLTNNATTPLLGGNIASDRVFNGAGQYLNRTDNAALNLTNAVTISVWAKLTSVAGNQKIIGKISLGTPHSGYLLSVANGALYPEFNNTAGGDSTFQSGTVPSGQWAHLAVTRATGGTIYGYVNGVQVGSKAAGSTNLATGTGDLVIGDAPWDPANVDLRTIGELDEVRIENVQHSGDWIKLCYQNQKANQTLVGFVFPPSGLSYQNNPVTYPVNTAITPNTATVTGTVDSFTVSPALPAGLSLAKTTGIISGTPTTGTVTANYTVTARNIGGTATAVLTITISALPSNLSYKRNPLTCYANLAITPDTAVVTGGVDSFTVSPALPAGLLLAKTTGIISGTPTTQTATASYTVTATNVFGSTTTPLTITVNPPLSPPSNLSYKLNPVTYVTSAAITPDTAVVTGIVDSFTVSPALPAGLSLAKATGIITGTPAVASAAANYTVTARNLAGSTTAVLSITVIAPPSSLSYKHNPVIYTLNAAIIPDTAAVTGTVDSFTVSPALPAGLSINRATGIVSGTPTTGTAAAGYTVTARNIAGSVTVVLTITVIAPPSNLSYKHNPVTYVTTAAITPDTAVVTGTVDSFTVSPALPAGLSLAKTTGIISGTPTTAKAAAAYTVTAKNAAGTTTVSLSITVIAPPSGFSYKHNPATYVVGTPITPDTAVVTGPVDSFTVSPTLPAGLLFDVSTGIISGTPVAAVAAANYAVTARNIAGAATVSLSITVNAALTPPANLSYKRNPVTFGVNAAIVPDTAVVTGLVDSFTVSPALPAGLTLVKSTGIITGTPTAAVATASYTVTAQNAAGSTTVALSITVIQVPSGLSYRQNPVAYVTNIAITPDTAFVNGVVDSFTVSPALPAGLLFAKATGIITGTPTTASAAANYTVSARNAAGTATVALSIAVIAPPVGLSYKHNPVTYVTGTAITPDSAVLTGGSAVDSFTVSPALPAGLSLAKPTGIITGTPAAAIAAASYTITARNIAGTATVSLSITVSAALLPPSNLTYSTNPAPYIVGIAIAANNPSSGGGAVASYSVAPALPAGLTLSTTTGVITGTPTAASPSANYTVTAANTSGSTTVALAITVYAAVKAAIWAHDSSGPAPLTIQFNDTSTGSYSWRRWSFGDGTIDTLSKNPTHTFSGAGTFIVKLTVWGSGGLDSAKKTILTWTPGSNPLQMDGTYLLTKPAGDSQKVAILIRNVNAISPPALVVVDSVGLWFTSGKIPTSPSPDSSSYKKKYLLSTLKSQPPGNQYADTVMIPAVPAVPGYCGFMTAISWSDGKRTPFSSGNGVLVRMKDTVPPVNGLSLSGQYVPNDTARLFVGNIASVDTNKVDSMFIWYSLTTDTADFSDKTFTRGLSMHEVTRSLVSGQYPFSIYNTSFFSSKKTIYSAVMVKGKNDLASPAKNYQFTVGVDRPVNPITLRAKALSATRIRVSWNDITSAGVSRIMIWYRTSKPVDTTYDVTALKLDTLNPAALTDTVVIGNSFNEKTRYYFGAQVFKGGLWSQITPASSATDSTPAAGAPVDAATLTLLNLVRVGPVFDTSTNAIRIGWTVNRNAIDSLDIGISYSTMSAAADTVVGQTVPSARNTDSVTLKLHEDLAFNTTYYVKLWLRRPGGKWTDPGAGSAGSVTTPMFTWQSVIYFTKDPDSVYAFNREIRLMNRPLDVSTTTNTVRYMALSTAALAKMDFTQVSVAVEFAVKTRGTPFYIGLKVDSLPAGYSLSDVRIYRDSAGLLLLAREPLAYDTAKRYVSLLTNDLDFPFIAMVDRRAPTARPLSDVSKFVFSSKPVFDTVVVHDNIANCSWRYLTARGGDPYDTAGKKVGGFLQDTCETLAVVIDSNFVTQDNGVRALLIVSDGVHYDTVNLSRIVLRDRYDITYTDTGNWSPLFVTAVLDTMDPRIVLRDFCSDTAQWKYDNTKFRMFHCLPASGEQYAWKWMEYADSLERDFEFARGKIVWVKALKKASVRFGQSHTASLNAVVPIKIAPKAWTDLSVPFKFDINVGDILNITSNGDSLTFYAWQRDVKTSRYMAELWFMKAMNNVRFNNPATPLSCNGAGFTVYNPRSDTVILNIPPLPVALSPIGLNKMGSGPQTSGWTVRVTSHAGDGSSLGSVYCGYSASQAGGVSYYPLAPSFGKVHAAVSDESGKKAYGIAIAHGKTNSGCAFQLTFVNDGSSANRISYTIENLGGMPQGVTAAVWNNESGNLEYMAAQKDEAVVTVAAGAREYRTLLVGDAGYLAKAKQIAQPPLLALVGTYPNPFKGLVRIRYNVPFEGVKSLKFTIYNLSGRVVWRHELKDVAKHGTSDLLWNGTGADTRPVAAGIYILRMTALNNGLKSIGVFERKMTMLQ
jgi:PKD repeat protein